MADWQAGDLALCIKQNAWIDLDTKLVSDDGPRCGEVHRVRTVHRDKHGLGLMFCEWPNDFFEAKSFIKVTPPSDMKAEPRAKAKPEQVAG